MLLQRYLYLLVQLLFMVGWTTAQSAVQTYDGGFGNNTNAVVAIRVGTGGAGQSGILKGRLIQAR